MRPVIAFVIFASTACAATVVDSGSPGVRITIHTPDGDSQQELSARELRDAIATPMPAFEVDGRSASDPALLLSGDHFALRRPTGGDPIVVTRSGRMVSAEGVEIVWNDELTHLQIGAAIAIDVDGVAVADRGRLAGRLIATFLGADTGNFVAFDPKADGGVTIAIILAVSYLTCITVGDGLCSDSAVENCPHGVDEYAMVCGAGLNVDGDFELGMRCTFRCFNPE